MRIPSRLGQPALRNSLNGCVPAGGTGQVFPVTVREDELEGFRGPVLLDATTSHFQDSRRELEWGIYARRRGGANAGRLRVLTAAPGRRTLAQASAQGASMSPPEPADRDYVPVAEVEVDSVLPEGHAFVLTGRGQDRAEYRLEMTLEMPIDQRTRTVIGEILSQSQWRLWRRASRPFREKTAARPPRAAADSGS